MTNGAVTWDTRVDLLVAAIEAAAADEPPELPPETSLRTVPDRATYLGRYRDGTRDVHVRADDDGLEIALPSGRDVDPHSAPLLLRGSDTFVTALDGWERYEVRFERDDEEVVRLVHGSRVFEREGRPVLPPPPPNPAWSPLVGRYRAYGIEPMHVEVLERGGRLFLIDAHAEEESELVPLDDGRFRIGTEPWMPGRARFETPVAGGEIRRLILDGAVFARVP